MQLTVKRVKRSEQLIQLGSAPGAQPALGAHSAGDDRPASKSTPAERRPQAHHLLLEDLKARLTDIQRGRLRLLGDHVEVACDSLELRVHDTPVLRPRRRRNAQCALDGLREG